MEIVAGGGARAQVRPIWRGRESVGVLRDAPRSSYPVSGRKAHWGVMISTILRGQAGCRTD